MSTNVPNLKQIGGGHRKTLVDLTWNDPIYTMLMQQIIRKHGVVYHKYADDTQLYVTYNGEPQRTLVLGDMQRAVKQLEDCIAEIHGWMINRMLKLNDNKTDMVIYMSQYHLNKYGRCDISIGDSTISPVEYMC